MAQLHPLGATVFILMVASGLLFGQEHIAWALGPDAEQSVGEPDFTIAANPSALVLQPGHHSDVPILLTSVNDFAGLVNLTWTSAQYVSAYVSPFVVQLEAQGSEVSNLNVTAPNLSPTTPAGNYTVAVTGTSGSRSHRVDVTVMVPDIGFFGSPLNIIINPSSTGVIALTAHSINVAGDAYFTATETAPASLQLSFDKDILYLRQGASVISNLTIYVSSGTRAGEHPIIVNVSTSLASKSDVVTVNVPGFSLRSAPSSLTVRAGEVSTVTLFTTSYVGFQCDITLTAEASTSSIATSLSERILRLGTNPNVILRLNVSSIISPGQYTVTVTGSGCSRSVSYIVFLEVVGAQSTGSTTLARPELITYGIATGLAALTFVVLIRRKLVSKLA